MTLDRSWYSTLVDDSGSGLDGSIWDKASVDALMDAVDATQVGCVLSRSIDQAIAPSVATAVFWDTEAHDPAGLHAPASALITLPADGTYLLSAQVTWQASASGNRAITFRLNSATAYPTFIWIGNLGASVQVASHLTAILRGAIGMTVEVLVLHDGGGALNVIGGSLVFGCQRMS